MKTSCQIAKRRRPVFNPACLSFITSMLLISGVTTGKKQLNEPSMHKAKSYYHSLPARTDSFPASEKTFQSAVLQVKNNNLAAIGIDSVIQLYTIDKINGNKPVLLQELYRGRGLKVFFYHEKTSGLLKLECRESLSAIQILSGNGDTIYEKTGTILNPVINIAAYQKGNYTLLATGPGGRCRQFFFSL